MFSVKNILYLNFLYNKYILGLIHQLIEKMNKSIARIQIICEYVIYIYYQYKHYANGYLCLWTFSLKWMMGMAVGGFHCHEATIKVKFVDSLQIVVIQSEVPDLFEVIVHVLFAD